MSRYDLRYLKADQQEGLRAAGQFAVDTMEALSPFVVPGRTPVEIDKIAHDYMMDHGHTPPMLNLEGFPGSTCICLNEQIVNGIPGDRVVSDADLVKVSLATRVDGWHSSCVRAFIMPRAPQEAIDIAKCAEECLTEAIAAISPNARVSQIGHTISRIAEERGYSVVREYVGHGIGRRHHQDPSIPGWPSKPSHKVALRPGTCFSIEPILNAGQRFTLLGSDNWTVRTKDGSLSSEAKQTLLMTETGIEVLTPISCLQILPRSPDGPLPSPKPHVETRPQRESDPSGDLDSWLESEPDFEWPDSKSKPVAETMAESDAFNPQPDSDAAWPKTRKRWWWPF